MKICIKCNIIKELGEFTTRGGSSDGHRNSCKLCLNEYIENWKKNPPVKKIIPEGMKNCPGCNTIKSIAYFVKKKSKKDGLRRLCIYCKRKSSEEERRKKGIKPRNKKLTGKDGKDRSKIYKHEWYEKNKQIVYDNKARRRARKLGVEENFGKEERKITMDAFEHKCFNCGATENLCVDHHRPLIKGNALTFGNAVVLCKTCNSRKFDKDPEEFYCKEKCEELDKKLLNMFGVLGHNVFQNKYIKKSRKIPIEEVEKQIFEIHGDIVKIDKDTYKGVAEKARFVDKDFGEWFAAPNKIIRRKQSHPKRRMDKITKTCLEKYGVKYPVQIKDKVFSITSIENIEKGVKLPNNKGEYIMTESKVLTGKVVWFDSKKGIGFIARDDGQKDLFVHWTNVEMEGYKTLKPGQVVSFEIGANDRGPQAVKIKVLKDAPKPEEREEDTF